MAEYKTYADKLLDVRWQKKRLYILERDGWACLECGCTDNTLHVHHNKYERGKDPWDYPDDVFETLCDPCHKKEHGLIHEPTRKHEPLPVGVFLGQIFKSSEAMISINKQIMELQNKLKEKISDELMIEIIQNLMFLNNQKKELNLK